MRAIFFRPPRVPLLVIPPRNLSKFIPQGSLLSVYRIPVAAITASALTSAAFAGCCEPAPIFRPKDCADCGQMIYGSPSSYTAVTKYTGYEGSNPYENQFYDTEARSPYPPYYSYPDYAPRYVLVITGYDGPRKPKSRRRRPRLEENALGYNEHTIRRIPHSVKLPKRALTPLSNVKAFSANTSFPTGSAEVTSSGQLSAPAVETPMPKVVELAGQRTEIVSADAVNGIDLVSEAPKASSLASFKRAKSEQLDIKQVDAKLTDKRQHAASEAVVAGTLEQSALDASKKPDSLAEALAAIAGALAALSTAWFLGLTPTRIPGFSRTRY
jgi:hypothetical protein